MNGRRARLLRPPRAPIRRLRLRGPIAPRQHPRRRDPSRGAAGAAPRKQGGKTKRHSAISASIFAAQMKSFSDRPPTEWVL
jgi:hypothetical protein